MFRSAAQSLRRSTTIASASSSRCANCSRPQRLPIQFVAQSRNQFIDVQSSRYYATQIPGLTHNSNSNSRKLHKATPTHKPPKRRLEAASQPLRIHTPTRGNVLPCIAHTSADRYDLINLGVVLKSLGVSWNEVPEQDKDRALVIGPWKGRGGAERLISGKDLRRTTVYTPEESGANNVDEMEDYGDGGFQYGDRGEIWVFGNGSFVTWGLTEEEGKAFLREVIRRKGANVESERLSAKEYEIEEMDFVVDPAAKTEILGNMILLGEPPNLHTFQSSPSLASSLSRYTISLSLTRSSSLSVLEDRLDTHIASVSTLPKLLERWGAQPMKRRAVIQKIGELMTIRMAVNTKGGGLDDTPEFYWSEPELEGYFDSVASEFEIKERMDAINKKIDYAQEVQSTLRALLTEASGHRMEIIIIVLIAVEAALAIIREYHDVAELVRSLFRTADDPEVGSSLKEEGTFEVEHPRAHAHAHAHYGGASITGAGTSDSVSDRTHWTEGRRLV